MVVDQADKEHVATDYFAQLLGTVVYQKTEKET
jgi:hypothetical protein